MLLLVMTGVVPEPAEVDSGSKLLAVLLDPA
jgi:hypothetical protein